MSGTINNVWVIRNLLTDIDKLSQWLSLCRLRLYSTTKIHSGPEHIRTGQHTAIDGFQWRFQINWFWIRTTHRSVPFLFSNHKRGILYFWRLHSTKTSQQNHGLLSQTSWWLTLWALLSCMWYIQISWRTQYDLFCLWTCKILRQVNSRKCDNVWCSQFQLWWVYFLHTPKFNLYTLCNNLEQYW